jgi:hypothetical protein
MKKLLLLLLIIILSRQCFAQIDSSKTLNQKANYGINLSGKALACEYGAITLGAALSERKHSFLIGFSLPQLVTVIGGIDRSFHAWYDNNCEFNKNESYKLFGIDLTYRKYLNPKNEYIKLFFFDELDFIMTRVKGSCVNLKDTVFSYLSNGTVYSYASKTLGGINGSGVETDYELSNNLGLGLKIKLFNDLYFNTELGVGYRNFESHVKSNFPNNSSLNSKKDRSIECGGTAIFNIGLEYEF